MSDLPVPFVRAWGMIHALKKLGFLDTELSVDTVRTLPGVSDPGVLQNTSKDAQYALAVIIARKGSTMFPIQVSAWPADPGAARVAWRTFCEMVRTGKITMPVLNAAVARHSFDLKKLEEDCRERKLLP